MSLIALADYKELELNNINSLYIALTSLRFRIPIKANYCSTL